MLPPDIAPKGSPIQTAQGPWQDHWFFKQVYQYDLGSNAWYVLKSYGPAGAGGINASQFTNGPCALGWPDDTDVLAKNPPWRYVLIWYWSIEGKWKQYVESKSWGDGCYTEVWQSGSVSGPPLSRLEWLGAATPPPTPPPTAQPPTATPPTQQAPADVTPTKSNTGWWIAGAFLAAVAIALSMKAG